MTKDKEVEKDILERIGEYSCDDNTGAILLNNAASEIRRLRMVAASGIDSGYRISPIATNDIILAALQGSATMVVTRHDCTPEKMVKAAIAIKNEMEKLK